MCQKSVRSPDRKLMAVGGGVGGRGVGGACDGPANGKGLGRMHCSNVDDRISTFGILPGRSLEAEIARGREGRGGGGGGRRGEVRR